MRKLPDASVCSLNACPAASRVCTLWCHTAFVILLRAVSAGQTPNHVHVCCVSFQNGAGCSHTRPVHSNQSMNSSGSITKPIGVCLGCWWKVCILEEKGRVRTRRPVLGGRHLLVSQTTSPFLLDVSHLPSHLGVSLSVSSRQGKVGRCSVSHLQLSHRSHLPCAHQPPTSTTSHLHEDPQFLLFQ